MSDPQYSDPILDPVSQLEQANEVMQGYREALLSSETTIERSLLTGMLRAAIEPDGLLGVVLNPELHKMANDFEANPTDGVRRAEVGRLASLSVDLYLREIWPQREHRHAAQVFGEARADKILADLVLYTHFFRVFDTDPPFDPAGKRTRNRIKSSSEIDPNSLRVLADSWARAETFGRVLERVEGLVLGGFELPSDHDLGD